MSVAAERVITVDPAKVRPFPNQPREYFDRDELIALELSIKNRGQLQPGIVRPLTGEDHEYELVDGQRRWHACRALKLRFRAVVIHVADENEQFEISIAANFQRSDHTWMEIARAIDRMCTQGKSTEGYVSVLFGKSQTWVNITRRLVDLCPEAQKLVDPPTPEKERIPLSVAQVLARLSKAEQISMLEKIRRKKLSANAAVSHIRKHLTQKGVIAKYRQDPSRQGRKISDYVLRTTKQAEHLLGFLTPEEQPRIVASLRDLGRLSNLRQSMRTAIERLETLEGKFAVDVANVKPAAPTPQPAAATTPSKGGEYVHSHVLQCSKCNKHTRFRRRQDADPKKDYWVCVKTGCLIKIAHVMIKVDKNYRGEAA